ncbi:MAG: hypothetical protein AB1724_12215 [Thermodesulfobacteriota bacterium]
MAKWQAKKLQLPNHNFETTAIKFEDGRVGLCYHGSVIWEDQGGGWEDFVAADWSTVWKEGTPCSFNDLPPDMRIACPVCGGKISPKDRECTKCGIVFEKMKGEPVKTESAAPVPQESEKKSRPRLVDVSLAVFALLIVGGVVFYTLKPAPSEPPSSTPPPAEEQSVSDRSQPPVTRPERSRERAPISNEEVATESQSETLANDPEEPIAVPEEQYYSHINLDDPETARGQLEEETRRINEEAAQVKEELAAAVTPEEKQRARENKYRYDQKAIQLSELIREFNARKKSAQ